MSKQMLELADWLLYMQRGHEASNCNNDPAIRGHIEKLKAWETTLRCSAVSAEVLNQPEPDVDVLPDGRCVPSIKDDALWALASTLHSNVPEADRPMSWSDYSPEQIQRLREAAKAFLGKYTLTEPQSAAVNVEETPQDVAEQAAYFDAHAERFAAAHAGIAEIVEAMRAEPQCQADSSPQTASGAVWSAEVHDRIIKRLMADVGMPNNTSLYTAFKQFANELCALSNEADRCQAGSAERLYTLKEATTALEQAIQTLSRRKES